MFRIAAVIISILLCCLIPVSSGSGHSGSTQSLPASHHSSNESSAQTTIFSEVCASAAFYSEVYFDRSGHFLCFNTGANTISRHSPVDGSQMWNLLLPRSHPLVPMRAVGSQPLFLRTALYIAGVLVDLETGKLLWTINDQADACVWSAYMFGSSVFAVSRAEEDVILTWCILTPQDPAMPVTVVALSAETGKRVWTAANASSTLGGVIDGSVNVVGTSIMWLAQNFTTQLYELHGLNTTTGQRVFAPSQVQVAGPFPAGWDRPFQPSQFFVMFAPEDVAAFSPANGQMLWESSSSYPHAFEFRAPLWCIVGQRPSIASVSAVGSAAQAQLQFLDQRTGSVFATLPLLAIAPSDRLPSMRLAAITSLASASAPAFVFNPSQQILLVPTNASDLPANKGQQKQIELAAVFLGSDVPRVLWSKLIITVTETESHSTEILTNPSSPVFVHQQGQQAVVRSALTGKEKLRIDLQSGQQTLHGFATTADGHFLLITNFGVTGGFMI